MNNYLSVIAERNIENDSFSLMPSTPVKTTSESELFQDFSDENTLNDNPQSKSEKPSLIPSGPLPASTAGNMLQDSGSENKPDELLSIKEQNFKNSEQVLPSFPQPSQPLTTKDKVAANASQKNEILLPYITRHVERIIFNEKNISNENDSQTVTGNNAGLPETVTDYSVINLLENTFKNTVGRDNSNLLNDPLSGNKSRDKLEPQKISVLIPEKISEKPGSSKDANRISVIERISPSKYAPDSNTAGKNGKNKVTPKLVIGKITVEIIPPVSQPAAKVITRLVQPSETENHPIYNRLTFGLGQM